MSITERASATDLLTPGERFARLDAEGRANFLAFLEGIEAQEAEAETPILALFREWRAQHLWMDGPATDGMPEAEFVALCRQNDRTLDRLLSLPPQNAADLAAKLVAATRNGEYGLEDTDAGKELLAEARALVGAA